MVVLMILFHVDSQIVCVLYLIQTELMAAMLVVSVRIAVLMTKTIRIAAFVPEMMFGYLVRFG